MESAPDEHRGKWRWHSRSLDQILERAKRNGGAVCADWLVSVQPHVQQVEQRAGVDARFPGQRCRHLEVSFDEEVGDADGTSVPSALPCDVA